MHAWLLAFYTVFWLETIRNLILKDGSDVCSKDTRTRKMVQMCAMADGFRFITFCNLANWIAYHILCCKIHTIRRSDRVQWVNFRKNLFPETTIATHTHTCSVHTMNKQINKQTIAFSFTCSALRWLLCYLWPFQHDKIINK